MTTRLDRYRSWGRSLRTPSLSRRISYVKDSVRYVGTGLLNSGARLKRKFSSRRSSNTSGTLTNVDDIDDDSVYEEGEEGDEEGDHLPPPVPPKRPRNSHVPLPPSGKYSTYYPPAAETSHRVGHFPLDGPAHIGKNRRVSRS